MRKSISEGIFAKSIVFKHRIQLICLYIGTVMHDILVTTSFPEIILDIYRFSADL